MPLKASSEETLILFLPGYIPATRNQLKGAHWSAEMREKARAAWHLRAAIESILRYVPEGQPIGMGTRSNSYKTALSALVSWMTTNGITSKAPSRLKRFQRKWKKAPKS